MKTNYTCLHNTCNIPEKLRLGTKWILMLNLHNKLYALFILSLKWIFPNFSMSSRRAYNLHKN